MRYLHILLFAIYPILFYFNNNKNEIYFSNIFIPLLYSLLFAAIIFGLIYWLIKRKENAGVLTSIILLLFFSYGHLISFLGKSFDKLFGWDVPYRNIIIGLWLFLVLLSFERSKNKSFVKVNPALNFISIFLILFLLLDIFKNPKLIQYTNRSNNWTDEQQTEVRKTPDADAEDLRDIYFIVPDRYPSNEVLSKQYGFDNSNFINYLSEKGFFIADKSRSVYPTTTMSLGSELNMMFLDEFTTQYGTETSDFKPVVSFLRNNEVGKLLKERGYTYINLGSWWHVTQRFDIADININSKGLANDEFIIRFLETTMFTEFADTLLPEEYRLSHRSEQKKTANFQSEKIKEVANMQSPKFVFVHFILPHPPYVFDKDCNYLKEKITDDRTEIENYKEQIRCANKKLKDMIDYILKNSKKEPIIILQSDEGPHPIKSPLPKDNDWKNADNVALSEKFKILNTLYLPGVDHSILQKDLSPVNTFRFIFNTYFEENFEYLPNKTFIFSDQGHIFDYKEITNELR